MDIDNSFDTWIANMPKAELHLHIDGSLQAGRLLSLAKKNKVAMPYNSVEQIEAAYQFTHLQSFLDLYYLGASVLRDEEDFYWLMMDYLQRCREQQIVHTEIMVEPQTYLPYGVTLATVINGFSQAIAEARQQWGQSVLLILSLLRHLSEQDALDTLEQAQPFRQHFIAVGLASSEKGNPPQKFERFYSAARQLGYRAVAHAGEEGPAQFIWDALKLLKVQRIDHGVRCSDDPELVKYLQQHSIPLTVCPLSNIRLRVFDRMQDHNVITLLEQGLKITINSDDPAYFGGFLNENFFALRRDLNLSENQALRLVKNSFEASFLSPQQQQQYLSRVDAYSASHPIQD